MKTTTGQETRVHAVIPAAGRGVRFGSPTNKIFTKLHGKPIIEWTVDALKSICDQVTVVAGQEDFNHLQNMVAQTNVRIALGGQTRQESVWNGLRTVDGDDTIVLVHDAARPLVSSELVRRCINSAIEYGSGIAAVQVVDSLKYSISGDLVIERDIDRQGVWAAQTPQAFKVSILRQAHEAAAAERFVGLDESSLVQRLPGIDVRLVAGERTNLKITTESDLILASQITAPRSSPPARVGIGYDIHRLVPGRELWLGGVQIQSDLGLEGHSDADVLIHAICDSLLGAAGLLDIGHMFPNTDPQFLGISSVKLLSQVADALLSDGWSINNVDAMLIAERPKISPYIGQMKSVIASTLSISSSQVSVKATTNEGIGSLGSAMGIACHATASIFGNR